MIFLQASLWEKSTVLLLWMYSLIKCSCKCLLEAGMSVHSVPSVSEVVLQTTHQHSLVGVGTHKVCRAQRN